MKQKDNVYPTNIHFEYSIKDGYATDAFDKSIIHKQDCMNTIDIDIKISGCTYKKEDVASSIKEICQIIPEYFQ